MVLPRFYFWKKSVLSGPVFCLWLALRWLWLKMFVFLQIKTSCKLSCFNATFYLVLFSVVEVFLGLTERGSTKQKRFPSLHHSRAACLFCKKLPNFFATTGRFSETKAAPLCSNAAIGRRPDWQHAINDYEWIPMSLQPISSEHRLFIILIPTFVSATMAFSHPVQQGGLLANVRIMRFKRCMSDTKLWNIVNLNFKLNSWTLVKTTIFDKKTNKLTSIHL